jgi:hypothetical protein
MLNNLLPQDSRAVELASAGAMVATAIYVICGWGDYSELFKVHRYQFWVIVFSSFGMLQFVSLLFHEKLALLQCILALVNGTLWVWLSALQQTPSAFFLGVSNLYAFSVGFLFLKKSWQN